MASQPNSADSHHLTEEMLDEEELADLAIAIHPSKQSEFDSSAYLDCFYSNIATTEPAMQVMLTYLPGIAGRMQPEVARRMIDVGSGPTVYTGFIFRNKVSEINFSDFSSNNIRQLTAFKENISTFNWEPTIRKIGLHEGATHSELLSMEAQTRSKINKIYKCDVFNQNILLDCKNNCINLAKPISDDAEQICGQFELVTSIFCLEYAGVTKEDFKLALANVLGLVKRGGTIVIGGCMRDRYYKFNNKSYLCHCLTENELMKGLEEGQIDIKNDFVYLNKHDTFIVKGTKL